MSPESSPSNVTNVIGNRRLYGWISECHGLWQNLFLAVPSFIFAVYLALQAKRSYSKLSQGWSSIMISYYVCLWLVTLLNLELNKRSSKRQRRSKMNDETSRSYSLTSTSTDNVDDESVQLELNLAGVQLKEKRKRRLKSLVFS
ncbi:hypothetical protein QQ045_023500 [Rhodiola kirilowii]